jgi:predicted Fe-Mo cluster-binding NifX family protein
MKIAVGSWGTHLDAWVGARFGYCPQFVIVDTETMDHFVVAMPPMESEEEASLKAIRIVVQNGADVVIVEEAKPSCREVMTQLGVEVIEGVQGLTVRQVVERYRSGALARPEARKGEPPKIAVAALGDDLAAAVGMGFGRVPRFVVVEPCTMSYEAIQVEPVGPEQKVRRETIRALVERSTGVVITPALTPECCQALWSFGIEVVIGGEGLTVGQAVEEYKAGALREEGSWQ